MAMGRKLKYSKDEIIEALKENGYNREEARKDLGVSRQWFHHYMKEYKLQIKKAPYLVVDNV